MVQNGHASSCDPGDADNPASGMSRRHFFLSCAYAAVTALACAGLAAAAALVPAPVGVIPLVAICVVLPPMMATWHLATAVPGLNVHGDRHAATALAQLRRTLDALPETDHPLGL